MARFVTIQDKRKQDKEEASKVGKVSQGRFVSTLSPEEKLSSTLKQISDYADSFTSDAYSRQDTFQASDAFNTYKQKSQARISELSDELRKNRTTLSESLSYWKDDEYDPMEEAAEQLSSYSNWLRNASSSLNQEADYWNQFKSENSYNAWKNYRDSSGNVRPSSSVKKEMDQLVAQRSEIEQRINKADQKDLGKTYSVDDWDTLHGEDLNAIDEINSRLEALGREYETVKGAEYDALRDEGYRDASWGDVLIKGTKQGYLDTRRTESLWEDVATGSDKAKKYEEKLEDDQYKFLPKNKFQERVLGATQLFGQQIAHYTDPATLALAGAGAGLAFAAGQAGAQAALPEEVLTVPGGALKGFKLGTAIAAYKAEAGAAYEEMLQNGVSDETAWALAQGVGAVNAKLEGLQVDEYLKGLKIMKKFDVTKGLAKQVESYLIERGLGIGNETLQEILQEGVTIAGAQLGSYADQGKWAYGAGEVASRLAETGISSAASFALTGLPSGAINLTRMTMQDRLQRTVQERGGDITAIPAVTKDMAEMLDGRPATTQDAFDVLVASGMKEEDAIKAAPEMVETLQERVDEQRNASIANDRLASQPAEAYKAGRENIQPQAQPVLERQIEAQAEPVPANRESLQRMADTLGESGSRAMMASYDGATDPAEFAADFAKVHNAAMEGEDIPANRLSDFQEQAAINSGVNDAEYQKVYEAVLNDEPLPETSLSARQRQSAIDAANQAKAEAEAVSARQRAELESESKAPGLVRDDYTAKVLDQKTADQLDRVARLLGVSVRFVNSVEEGKANAKITGREVLVEKYNPNPVRFLLGHEWTHRVQAVAPKAYDSFKAFIKPLVTEDIENIKKVYAEKGRTIGDEAALDEAVANYAGRMLMEQDGKLLDDFIERNRQDRTLLEKFRDAVKELVAKLTGAEKRMAETAVGKLNAALDEAAKNAGEESASETKYDIKQGMTDEERYEELKNKQIVVRHEAADIINAEQLATLDETEEYAIKIAKPVLEGIADSLKLFERKFASPSLDFEFLYSKGMGFKKSTREQMKYGGSWSDFAKALAHLDSILENAVLIEKHGDIYVETERENPDLNDVSTLIGLFEDEDALIPVKLTIKSYKNDSTGRLYLTVAMTKINKADVVEGGQGQNPSAPSDISTYMLSDIIKQINPADRDFLKYIPDDFLNEEQKAAKELALEEERKKIAKIPKKEKAESKFSMKMPVEVKDISERFGVSEADAAPAVEAINGFKGIQLEMDLAGLMNKSKVQTIFDAFKRDLIYKGGVDFVGRTFKDVNELAVAASVFRDPRFETARYFFLDDNGKVVMNTGVSSQIPNAAAVFAGKGRDEINKFINETFNKASDLGATTVCLLHNHPSGDVTPSSADFSAVRMLENLLSYGPMKLGEAIIIDHGKYTRFRSDGFKQQVVYDFGNADPMVSTGETVLSPEAVKQVAASVNAEENDMVLIFSNTKGKVTGIQKIAGDYFKDYDSFRQYVHDEGIKFGSAKTFASVHNAEQSLRTIIGKAYEDNIITDAVMGDYSYADYGLPKKRAGDGEYAGQEHVGEVRFSLKDSEGRNLTKAQQEFFKDSKVLDEDGNLLVVYHGTDADFTVFDRTKGRSTMDIQGSFFSPWDIDAGGYGPNVKAYYLNLKNPAPEGVAYKALNRFKGQNNAGIRAREYLESLGYDGVNNGGEEYIAFNPEQIKLVDNKNPTADPDIRFSMKGSESNTALSDDDLEDYIKTGNSSSKRHAVRDGKKVILTSKEERADYIGNAIKGVPLPTVGYAKIGNRLCRDILTKSGGQVDLTGGYLELVANDLRHSYNEHRFAKEEGDIDLSDDVFLNIDDYIDNYDEVLAVNKYQDGRVRVRLSATIPGGKLLIIEVVSKDRNSLQPKTIIGVTKEKYNEIIKRNDPNIGGGESLNISPSDDIVSNNKIAPDSLDVNENERFSFKGSERAGEAVAVMESSENTRKLVEDYKALQKDLAKQTARAERAEGQMKLTEKPTVREADVKKLAKERIAGVGSDVNANEITKRMTELGNKIVQAGRDGSLAYDAIKDEAIDIARDIVEGAKELTNSEALAVGKKIKNYLKGKKFYFDNTLQWRKNAPGYMAKDTKGKGEFTDYKYLHAKNLGRFTLTADPSATQIDKAWAEMQEIFGKEWFPEDITTVPEMITHISGLLDDMEPIYENPYSYDMAEVIEYEANAIIDGLISEHVRQTAPTYADKMQRKVDIARFHEAEALRRVREQRDAKIAALKEHYKQAAADKRARKDDSEARTRLLKIAKRLNNRKMTAVNRARLNEYIGDLDLISKGITGKSIEKLSALREWYDDKIQNDPDFTRDEHIEKAVARLSKRHISELTQTEVAELTEVLLNIENELRTEKKLIDSQIKHDIAVAGAQIISDVENSRGSDGGVMDEMVVTELLSPEREAKRLTGYNENDPLLTATKELSAGQRKMFDYRRRAESRFTKWVQDKKFVQDIAGKKAREITITGSTNKGPVQVKITPAMRMSLYLHSLNDQNLKHISQGGITIPNMEWYKKGDLQKALDKGVTIRLSPSQVREITSQMTAQERAFAQAAHDYFNGMSRDEINAVSEQLKGYSLASVENYFPINTDKNFLKKEFDSIKQDGTIEGMGFLKERVNSANPIMLRDMNEVLDNSIKQHSKYVGLAIAVRNFNKLWNATVGGKDQEGNWNSFANSVQGAISKKWGSAAKTYVERMMKDLNNTSSMHEVWGEKMAKVRSNYAKAVLEMNAGVAVKQAASYPTAAAVVGWGPLLKAMKDPTNRKVDLDLVAKYTPLLWYRSQGFSSQELGDIKNQGKSLPKALNWIQAMDVWTTTKLWTAAEYYVRDNTNLQQGSDAYYQQVADVYNRIIEETQPNYTTMQRPQLLRSENELVKTVNMFKTQPFQNFNVIYDAVGEMRAKKAAYTNTGTAEAKAAYDAAKKKAALAISSQAISAVTFALMQFAWDAFRGKDDKYKDEEGDESLLAWLKGMGLNMLSNGFGMLPYGGFMLELAETATDKVLKELDKDPFFDAKFYGLEASPLQTVNDTGEGLIKLISETAGLIKELSSDGEPNFESYSRTMYQTVEGWAQLLGKPVANVRKDFEALAYQLLKSTKGPLMGRYYSTRITSDPAKYPNDYYDLLYKAKKKDVDAYSQIYDLMMSDEAFGGNAAGEVFTDKKIKSAIESRMKKDQGVESVSDLSQRYLTPDQQKEYDKTLGDLRQSSIWKEATAGQKEKALDALYNIASGSDSGQKKQETIKASGLSETEYLLYMTALDMVDRGTIGSYDQLDTEAAIRLLPVSDAKKDKLWSSKYKKAAPNW